MLVKPRTAVLVTAPSVEPVSLAEAKAQCRIDSADTDHNAVLNQAIKAARSHFDGLKGVLGRALATQTWDVKFDGFPGAGALQLPLPPVQSITHVKYLDADGAEQTLASSVYQAIGLGADTRVKLALAYDQSWPSTRLVPEAVTVRIVCGWGFTDSPPTADNWEGPRDLKHAMLMLIGHWWENREAVTVGVISAPIAKAVDDLAIKYTADWMA